MTAVVALVFSSSAFAQDDPTSAPAASTTTTTTTPPPTSEAPPPPAQAKASVNGVLYADKNGDGQQDPGEAVSGEVTVVNASGGAVHKTTSDADGKFTFEKLAPGTYRPTYRLADGWVVHHVRATGDLITVTENATTEVTARAERPYSEQITAVATLGDGPYGPGMPAMIMLTLTNTTGHKISGIQARCERGGSPRAVGRGPGWNELRGDGIQLEAGQRRSIKIVEEIPQAARDQGVVTLDCDIAPNVEWNTDGPSVHDVEMVSGRAGGGYAMLLGEDRDTNQRIDAGEAVGGVEVVVLNLNNGEQVTAGTSDASGKIVLTGLDVGEYRVVPLGSWGFRDAGQEIARITAQGATETKFLKSAPPADLRVKAKFEKPSYESHEIVRLDLTVTNAGGQTAERVTMTSDLWPISSSGTQDGDFDQRRGTRIPAGESRTFSWQGKIRELLNGELIALGSVNRLGAGGTPFYAQAGIVATAGEINGLVYLDRNHNGQPDSGEAAANTVVEANGGLPFGYFKTTTDAHGRYSFKNVPSGDWVIGYTLAGGWIVHGAMPFQPVRVEPGKPVEIVSRAERPYAEALTATMVLDKTVYAIGDQAKITVTVANKAGYAIGGIIAWCDSPYNNYLGAEPMAESWADLRPSTPGLTLGAGESKTYVVTEKVPEGAKWKNKVIIACSFGPGAGRHDDVVSTYDWASVPGGVGTLDCPLWQDKNGNFQADPGEGIPNTLVVLKTDREHGATIAEMVSDAYGFVHLDEVPPGDHWAFVDGPWKFADEYGNLVDVSAGQAARCFWSVVPAPSPPSGDGQGSGGGGTRGALAKTGASVLGLGVLAALLVTFGVGARMIGRRRTT